MGDWTGTVPTYASGDEVPASKMQIETAIETALTAVWTPWTPTLTNLTLGLGTQVAKYRRLGVGSVDFLWTFLLGSGSAVGTLPSFTLPFAPSADWIPADTVFPVRATLVHTGVSHWLGETRLSGSTVSIYTWNPSNGTPSTVTATAPFTWVSGDALVVNGTYYT